MDGINEFSSLHCSAEWHIQKLGCSHALAIYNLSLRVAYKSGRFSATYPTLALYFGVHERTIRRAIHGLREIGFFEVVSLEPGRPCVYKPVLHKPDWIQKNPGECIEKIVMPWDGEGDLLGRELFAICDGRVKFFYTNVMKGMRATGLTDLEIAAQMKRFRQIDKPPLGKSWTRGFVGRFMKHLKQVSTNNPGHLCPDSSGHLCPEVGPNLAGVPRPQVPA